MKKLLIVLLLLVVLFPAMTGAQAQKLLDCSFYEEVGILVYVGPEWTLENQALYAGQTTTDLYGKPYRYDWRLIHGAWRWKAESGVELTKFRTYFATPTMQDAMTAIALVNNLTYSGLVDWNPQTGFAIPTGSLGLRNPRVELVIWYNDGSIRHILISQTETLQGGMYAFVYDHIASKTEPHPLGLYVLKKAPARALTQFAIRFTE